MLDSPERVCAGQAWFEYPATFVLFSNCITDGVHFGEKQAGPAVDSGGRTSSGLGGQLNLTACGNLVAAQPVHAVGLAGGGPQEPILQLLGLA
jgi:hypothetical protein